MPIGWQVNEVPNPLAFFGVSKGFVGYPLSVSIHDDATQRLRITAAILHDSGGQKVSTYQVNSGREPVRKNHLFLISRELLVTGMTYEAEVSGEQVKRDGSIAPFHLIWRFTTGYKLMIADAQGSLLGEREYLRVVMANGELPDLQYVLQKDKQTIRTFSAASGQYMAYGPAILVGGTYQLEISSSLFPANSVSYEITLSGNASQRRVEWRK